MDRFVNALKAEGRQDSEGVFTIAVDKASWKLAAFRLAVPESYPLHVVASAVAGQAGRVTIIRESGLVRFFFDGQTYSQDELRLLSQPVLGEGTPRRVRQLAIAVSAGSALGALRFVSFGTREGCQLEVSRGEVSLTRVAEGSRGQLLEVQAPLSDVAVEILKTRCRFAPVDLTVDGANLRSPIDFGIFESNYYGYYLAPGETDLVVRPPTLSSRKFFHWTAPTQAGLPTIHLALTGAARAQTQGLTLLADGIGHPLDAGQVLGFPYLCGAVCANHLKKDISQSGFVDNRDYQELMALLRASALDFLERFCSQPSSLPRAMLPEFRHFLLEMPQAVDRPGIRDFLSRTARDVPLTDPSSLKAKGRAFVAGRQQEYLEAKEALRAQLSLNRKNGKGEYKSTSLLEAETLLHQAAGIKDQEFAELQVVWDTVYPGPVVKPAAKPSAEGVLVVSAGEPDGAGQIWAKACLEGSSSVATRYRARLILLPRMSLEKVELWFDQPEVAVEWWALIRFVVLAQQGRLPELYEHDLGCLREPLLAVVTALGSDPIAAQRTFVTLAGRVPQGPRWLEVGAALSMPRCRIPTWVAFRARLSMAATSDPAWKTWNLYRDWKGLLGASAVEGIAVAGMVNRVFTPSFLPLLVFRLALSHEPRQVLSLLSRVLLQQSLGPLGSALTNLDSLPLEGLMWDGYGDR